jgi:hypothetical protein
MKSHRRKFGSRTAGAAGHNVPLDSGSWAQAAPSLHPTVAGFHGSALLSYKRLRVRDGRAAVVRKRRRWGGCWCGGWRHQDELLRAAGHRTNSHRRRVRLIPRFPRPSRSHGQSQESLPQKGTRTPPRPQLWRHGSHHRPLRRHPNRLPSPLRSPRTRLVRCSRGRHTAGGRGQGRG